MNVHSLRMNQQFQQVKGEKREQKPKQIERKQKMKKLSLILIGLMACFAIGVSTGQGQVFYILQDLGVVKGMDTSEASALNNLGQVAGTAYQGEQTCAFHYDYAKGFMEDAGGVNSRAFGISSTNMIVGDSFFGPAMEPRSHAAMFTGGGFVVDLGVLRGQVYSRANGVNAIGQVVGFSGRQRDSSESKAFMWSKQTGMIDLGTLGGSYAQANAINDGGFITGTSQTKTMSPVAMTHAFIYQPLFPGAGPIPRPMRDLGVLGGASSYGMAINNNNHVAGYSTTKTNGERVHAFLHDGKSMIDLGSLGLKGTDSDVSIALGVNTWDQVVGYSFLPSVGGMPLQRVAFLWRPNGAGGEMINLNRLLGAAGRNYLLFSATAINDNGQIVASAYDIQNGGLHAVLLTPARTLIGK
jgi:probable HAF family extracellular repeat protein